MSWPPNIGGVVLVTTGTGTQRSGHIVDDFGDGAADSVDVNGVRISDPARRWAVLLDDGDLIFVDTEDLNPPDTGR